MTHQEIEERLGRDNSIFNQSVLGYINILKSDIEHLIEVNNDLNELVVVLEQENNDLMIDIEDYEAGK